MGLTTVHTPNRVVSRRGRKQCGRKTTGERGNIVSMALAVSASGIRAPPYLIFPRARFHDHFLLNGPTVCWGGATPSGFMNGENFLNFITEFQEFTRCTPKNPILLLMDNLEAGKRDPCLIISTAHIASFTATRCFCFWTHASCVQSIV